MTYLDSDLKLLGEEAVNIAERLENHFKQGGHKSSYIDSQVHRMHWIIDLIESEPDSLSTFEKARKPLYSSIYKLDLEGVQDAFKSGAVANYDPESVHEQPIEVLLYGPYKSRKKNGYPRDEWNPSLRGYMPILKALIEKKAILTRKCITIVLSQTPENATMCSLLIEYAHSFGLDWPPVRRN